MWYRVENPPAVLDAHREAMAPVRVWLETEAGDFTELEDLIGAFARRLVASQLPLTDLMLGLRELHPELFAINVVWHRRADSTSVIARMHGVTATEFYLNSPARAIFEGAAMVRGTIDDPARALLDAAGLGIDAEARGIVLFPLRTRHELIGLIGVMIDRPWSDDEICRVLATRPLLTRLVEIQQLRTTARGLLDVYVGRDAGQRILDGAVRRGESDAIEALIFWSDLAGFTALSETMDRMSVIGLLNRYFDTVGAPVLAAGGEILKFMGDAVLAIFRLPPTEETWPAIAAGALEAADAATAAMDAWNIERTAKERVPLTFGIGLHIGTVAYGNVGTASRLDFTVIGPAVNTACRLEHTSRALGPRVIMSEAFARLVGDRAVALGEVSLRGVKEPQRVFTRPAEATRLPATTGSRERAGPLRLSRTE